MNASSVVDSASVDRFDEVLALIYSSRQKAIQAVNTQLIELYWQVGAYISRKLEQAEWGDAVIGPDHLWPEQTPGRARVLPAYVGSGEVVET